MEWTTKMEGGGTLYLRDDGTYVYLEANRSGAGSYQVILQGLQGGQILGQMNPCETGLKLARMVSRSTMSQWGCLPLVKVICQESYPYSSPEGIASSPKLPLVQEEAAPPSVEDEEQWEEIPLATVPLPLEEEELWEEVPDLPLEPAIDASFQGFRPCLTEEIQLHDPILASCFRRCSGVLLREGEGSFALAVPYFPHKEFHLTSLLCLGYVLRLGGEQYVGFSFHRDGKPFHESGIA